MMTTLRQLQARASSLGYTVKKQDGEYRVALTIASLMDREGTCRHVAKQLQEDRAYYTTDIDDAYDTLIRRALRDG